MWYRTGRCNPDSASMSEKNLLLFTRSHSQKRKKIINTTKGTLLGHFVVTNDEKGSWTFHGPAVFFF